MPVEHLTGDKLQDIIKKFTLVDKYINLKEVPEEDSNEDVQTIMIGIATNESNEATIYADYATKSTNDAVAYAKDMLFEHVVIDPKYDSKVEELIKAHDDQMDLIEEVIKDSFNTFSVWIPFTEAASILNELPK